MKWSENLHLLAGTNASQAARETSWVLVKLIVSQTVLNVTWIWVSSSWNGSNSEIKYLSCRSWWFVPSTIMLQLLLFSGICFLFGSFLASTMFMFMILHYGKQVLFLWSLNRNFYVLFWAVCLGIKIENGCSRLMGHFFRTYFIWALDWNHIVLEFTVGSMIQKQ